MFGAMVFGSKGCYSTISYWQGIVPGINNTQVPTMRWSQSGWGGYTSGDAWFSSPYNSLKVMDGHATGSVNIWCTHADYFFLDTYVTVQRPALIYRNQTF